MLCTENLKQLTYHVVGRGDVITSGVVEVPNVKSFQFEIKPTMAMVPKANVVVYYITDGGEIISDKIVINFGNELQNFVSN